MQQRMLCICGMVCLLAVLGLALRPAQATEYHLQVTNLDYLTFSRYLENSTPSWRGEEDMRPGGSARQTRIPDGRGDSRAGGPTARGFGLWREAPGPAGRAARYQTSGLDDAGVGGKPPGTVWRSW
jgi:hypothetical protein